MEQSGMSAEDILKSARQEQKKTETTEEVEEVTKDVENKPDIQKIYIKNYGNLVLEIVGTNDIGLLARSEKRKEDLFVPWTSIIMCSKVDGE